MNSNLAYRRIRFSLPVEGWMFSVILGFVAVCSVLRSVNMLVVVSGMMLAALLLSWRLSRNSVRNITVRRKNPNRIHVGQPVNIQWEITNCGSYTVFRIKIVDSLTQVFSRLGGNLAVKKNRNSAIGGTVMFRKITVGDPVCSSYRVLFTERGIYEFGLTTVESRFPLALVRSWFRTSQFERIHVAPRLGTLAPQWEQVFSSRENGASSAPNLQGTQEEEIFAIREWRSGDNKRKIHWRSTAKQGLPMVKQFDRIAEQHRAIVLDLYADPMSSEGYLDRIKECELALSFAASALSQWSEQSHGILYIAINTSQPVCYSSVEHVEFSRQCMQALSCAQASPAGNLNQTVGEIVNIMKPDTPCLVVSSRPHKDAINELHPELHGRIRWLHVQSPAFEQIFNSNRAAENFDFVEHELETVT